MHIDQTALVTLDKRRVRKGDNFPQHDAHGPDIALGGVHAIIQTLQQFVTNQKKASTGGKPRERANAQAAVLPLACGSLCDMLNECLSRRCTMK